MKKVELDTWEEVAWAGTWALERRKLWLRLRMKLQLCTLNQKIEQIERKKQPL